MAENLISALDLKGWLDRGDDFTLLDVRSYDERDITKIDYGCHIPLDEITESYEGLDKDKDIVIYCNSGTKSFQVCRLLEMLGFAKVRSLVGGIYAWAKEIDTQIKRY